VHDRLAVVLRYARAHHARSLLIGFAAVTSCIAVIGTWEVSFPAANGVSTFPFGRELPIVIASLIGGSLDSEMTTLEETSTVTLRRLQWTHAIAVVLLGVLLTGGSEVVVATSSEALMAVRGLLIWTGLAMLSGRIFGWLLSWLLPVMTVFPLIYFGQDLLGVPRWWDWTSQPATYLPCWLLASGSLIVGACSFALTSWRFHFIADAGKRVFRG